MDLTDVTLIVPTRNEAVNIERFLESLPAALALVIVDASDDGTVDIVAARRPEHTRIVRDPGSVTEARQLGAVLADTEWLLFSDADVAFAPDYFARLAELPEADAVYGPKLSSDEFAGYYRWFARGQQLCHALGIPAASGSNLLVRRCALHAVGGFDLALRCNEDSELVWRIKSNGAAVRYDRRLVVHATDHRRLYGGRIRKTLHSVARCALLRAGLIPARWRHHDWGYWSTPTTGGRVCPKPKTARSWTG
jgi:glycosyltransferase involved in cell wall biosynthesis